MTKTSYDLTWDLDIIFEGGSDSEAFKQYLHTLNENLNELSSKVDNFRSPKTAQEVEPLVDVIKHLETVTKQMRESGAFISCLSAQNVDDKKAGLLRAQVSQLGARFSTSMTQMDQKLAEVQEDVWEELLTSSQLNSLEYVLNEKRKRANENLPLEQEAIINDLSIDGYHAWGQMYNTIVGKMSVEVEENGETHNLSVGQASNKLSAADRNVRQTVFHKLQNAWTDQQDLFGETINHLSGFRLQTYKHRGWDHVLKEPLDINRMSEKTLDTMWSSITKYKGTFVKYLERKAHLLGLEKLNWYDVGAPITNDEKTVTYDEGAKFIVDQFNQFGPKMASFAEMAFEKRWIEAEDRSGKRPGGFCTSFPDSKQTRIFMTYSGTASNVATLAHELGHAFHQHVMDDVHPLNQRYAMNVAETASTFAEMIVADAAVKNAETDQERLSLLEDKVNRSVAFFMNIHARFLFETRFYDERKEGLVSVERLNTLMEEAQKEAFCDALGEYDPHMWASKLHFHITGVPFYNFPYTFGYLFSLGIYAKALEEGSDFEEKYIDLLKDTGSMRVEDLAKKHLNVDLEQPEFWENAIKLCVADVEEFLRLSE
ncbi:MULTISPECIES: M3 family oligoendopeptidase [Pontibacillus]|uniref:M3 family oligoendopeptidase n=1 Tax=Pontibacillus chungwhensis TaxID=265426 RepID=A0ABY8URI9_9BACI|nr:MULTISPECIES: M3 family oligoendopeptidase [Pontibacillus]MCD5322890.1 M3 family oligoendopeptidase [Pontibacillus sp. HN14]WIF96287.1 M3 family oligoendopeptidase [Pontibacillus chungwhensis]